MKLLNATDFKTTAVDGVLNCTITIQRETNEYDYVGEDNPETLLFTYDPTDQHGASPLVAVWIADHKPIIAIAETLPSAVVQLQPLSPIEKLKVFLEANPDVKSLLV